MGLNASQLAKLLAEEVGPALKKGVIPEAEERAAGAALRHVERPEPIYRNPDLSFGESSASQKALSSIPNPKKHTLAQATRRLAEAFGGLFEAEPGMPKDVKAAAKKARWKSDAAGAVARQTVKTRVLDRLQGEMPERIAKAELLQRLIINTDDLATIERKLKADPDAAALSTGGRTYDEVRDAQMKLLQAASGRPDVIQAYTSYRNLVDELFDNYVARGYISPDRRLDDYTPFVKIEQINDANGRLGGSGAKRTETVLNQLRSRQGGSVGLRHTGALRLLIDQMEDFNVKAAEDEMLLGLLSDKTLNRTAEFPAGTELPPGYVRWRPEPGMPGYGVRDDQGNLVAGFVNTLGNTTKDTYFDGLVIPERLARFLNEFKPATPPEMQSRMYKAGSALARQLTVYNPANTALNLQGDVTTALLGKAGEPAQPIGIIKNYFKAADSAINGLLRGKQGPEYIKAIEEGVTSGTYASTIDGVPMDTETAQLLGEQVKGGLNKVPQTMRAYRQVVEATPRIASGMEAESRGADFGEAARYATLEFGAGSPAHTRNPTFRFMFPFWTYLGLASKRVAELLTTKGSRGRTLAALAVPPVATMMWNIQNPEYQEVENSLPSWYKDQMHAIVPDPRDPSKPLIGPDGKAVVVPMRWLVTEQVAQLFGLGNLPSRLGRVAVGRDKPEQFAAESATNVLKAVGQQAVPLNMAGSLLSGRDQLTGEEKHRAELVARSIPMGRDVIETVKAARNFGAAAAGQRVVSRIAGVGQMKPGRKDATLNDLIVKRNELRRRMRSAYKNGDRFQGDQLQAELRALQADIKRVAAVKRKGK